MNATTISNTSENLKRVARAYLWVLLAHAVVGLLLLPVQVHAQQSGNAPVFGKAVQGQSATGIEGTLETAVNYVSNVIGPLVSGGFFIHALLAWHNNGKPMRSVLTGVGCLGISQALRLAEWMVNTGQAGVH
jgi:hypothetical protein